MLCNKCDIQSSDQSIYLASNEFKILHRYIFYGGFLRKIAAGGYQFFGKHS